MCRMNVLEAKTNFSRLLAMLENREEDEIIICRNNKEVAIKYSKGKLPISGTTASRRASKSSRWTTSTWWRWKPSPGRRTDRPTRPLIYRMPANETSEQAQAKIPTQKEATAHFLFCCLRHSIALCNSFIPKANTTN